MYPVERDSYQLTRGLVPLEPLGTGAPHSIAQVDQGEQFRARYELLLAQHLPAAAERNIEEDASLADLGLNSLGAVQLLMAVEDEFQVVFPDELVTIETFESVGSLRKTLWDLLKLNT